MTRESLRGLRGQPLAEDGFAIAALGFASCPAFAGMTGVGGVVWFFFFKRFLFCVGVWF